MAKIQNTRIIFVEGDTEVSLFNNLKKSGSISAKKIAKKNLWDECIKKYAINIPKNCDIIIVFDTDTTLQSARFIQNVEYLLSRKHKIILMQQTLNFEDEIAHCCNMTTRRLFTSFCKIKTPSASDFKRDFIACNNPVEKLTAIGWDKKKWFVRKLHASLQNLIAHKSNYVTYFE